mgnify:CR=1 FL=1
MIAPQPPIEWNLTAMAPSGSRDGLPSDLTSYGWGNRAQRKDAPSSAVRSSVRARPDVAYSYAPRMEQTKNQPAIVNVPRGDGRVVLFATNPCYRWQNHGEFNMLFNTILHYND